MRESDVDHNKPTRKQIKEVRRIVGIFRLKPPREDDMKEYNTILIANPESIRIKGRYFVDIAARREFCDGLFGFYKGLCDEFGVLSSFYDTDRYVNDSYCWAITYEENEAVDADDIDLQKVFVVAVYRKCHGLKLVGIAKRRRYWDDSSRDTNVSIRIEADAALNRHIQHMGKRSWAEVSGKLEKCYHRALGDNGIVLPEQLIEQKVFDGIEPCIDGLHYSRPLRKDGPEVWRIVYGII